MFKWIKKLLLILKNDPIVNCEVYKDNKNGSCMHVDGILCDYPNCSI